MKCIKKDGIVQRVKEEVANKKVNEGWVFCPKSEWKENNQTIIENKKKEKK